MDGASDSQLCAEVYKRGGHLLETGEYFDCKFLVGVEPQEEIASHKLILSMASRVFEALFKDNEEKSDLIRVEDIQPEIFKLLLQYIYTGSMKVNSIYDACNLYSAAEKYMLQHLLEECRRYLRLNVTSNVWQVLKFAQLHQDKELLLNCESIFATYTSSILNDINFEDAHLDTVITVFSNDTLSIDSETQLIKAAARYAEAQNITVQEENTENNSGRVDTQLLEFGSPVSNSPIKKSSKIRMIAEKIRFLRLTPNQFAELSERNSILTLSEQFAVIMNQASTNCNVPLPSGFSRDKGQRHMFQKVQNKEGSFTYTVYGFTHLDSVLSPPFYVLNLPWQLKYVAKDENGCRRLSILCSTQNISTWSCEVDIVIKIFNPASVIPVPHNALTHWNTALPKQHSVESDDFTCSATILFCRESSAYFFPTDTVNWGRYINKDGSVKFTVEIKKKVPEALQIAGVSFGNTLQPRG